MLTVATSQWSMLSLGRLNSDNTANDWAMTGIQLEVGTYTSSTLPPFQHESFGDNLARCQRYYLNYADVFTDNGPPLFSCQKYNATVWYANMPFPVNLRTTPTVISPTDSLGYRIYTNGGTVDYNQIDLINANTTNSGSTNCRLQLDGATGGTAGESGFTKGNAAGVGLAFEAEL